MATYNKFQQFAEDLCLGVHNLHTGLVKAYLSNATPSASADAVKTDLAEISSFSGYTAGGHDTQNTISETGGTATMNAVDIVITAGASGGPFQYVAIYNDTPTSPADPLIAWWDYGSAISLANGETFTIDFGSNKIFDLA